MFDAGEDTQRQVHKQPLVRNGKVDRIFITNRRAGNVLGLPGENLSASAALFGFSTLRPPESAWKPSLEVKGSHSD